MCKTPPKVNYGAIHPSSRKRSYSEDDYVVYRCNPGYCLYGNPRVTCGHRGWSKPPSCRRKTTSSILNLYELRIII